MNLQTDIDQAVITAPLSRGQRALWFLQQLSPASAAYNLVYAAKTYTQADFPAFERALREVIARHDVLRSTFVARAGQPVRLIHNQMEGVFTIEDVQDWGEVELLRRLNAEVDKPFDLERGPLIRLLMLKCAPQEWLLLLAMHHIITDLWSFAVFMYELGKLYQQEAVGIPAKLRRLRVNYTGYVQQQEAMLAGPDGDALWEYWRNQLDGELEPLELLTDYPRPIQQTYQGGAQSLLLDTELTQALNSLSERQNVPLHITLLAAFQTLLHKYTGQKDILVGSPKAGRSARYGRLMGYFVNTIVLRAQFASDPSFLDLLDQVDKTVSGAFEHDAFPFPTLVERLQPNRDLSRSPIFQVMFAWQKTTRMVDTQGLTAFALNQAGTSMSLGGIMVEPIPLSRRVVPFDLALWMSNLGNGLAAMLEYNIDLFKRETITQILAHFETLLRNIVHNPGQRISELPLITAEERHTLLYDWNEIQKESAIELPAGDDVAGQVPPLCVTELIAAQAGRTPDVIAVLCEDTQLTYSNLDRRSNQLAHYLQEQGIGVGDIVGLCMERSAEMIVGILGILKAGATYLPLDPIYPQHRMSFILKDAQVPVVLTQERLVERLSIYSTRLICLDADWETIALQPVDTPDSKTMPDSAAYVIYTSGSTGLPKGALIPHRAIARHCQEIVRYYELTPQDRVLQFASLNFDASLEQIFPTLIAGARLVVRDEVVWTPVEFYRQVQEQRLTVINVPPAYWHQLASGWKQDLGIAGLQQIRLVIIGGDVMQSETLRLWRQTPMKDARILNAYGPTETTITATTFEIPPDFELQQRIPIGCPVPPRKAYILDDALQPVPIGVPGELYLGGMCLATGYLNQPELTQERFIPNPFVEGERLYKTGDLVFYRPDRNIEFFGRVDHQVKIRGFRIELGEIESMLKQYAGVEDAVVMVREDIPGKQQLVGYIAIDGASPPESSDLVTYLKSQVPAYMVPSAFVILDALPLASGIKVDRQALPVPEYLRSEISAAYVSPATPVETELVELWSEVLGIQEIGINDNFFELGGHSLLATQIISRVRDLYQVEVPLRVVFDTPTIAGLSAAITYALVQQESGAELESLLAELDNLSEEEVRNILGD